MNRSGVRVGILAALCMFNVAAAPLPMNIVADENGNLWVNGVLSLGFFSNDPGPGGLPGVLTYTLPFAGVQGDVAVAEPDGFSLSDFVRFNGDGTLIFYSQNLNGFDSFADTPSPPQDIYPNLVLISEFGNDSFSAAVYTPGPDDPGFDASNPNYIFLSEQSMPEPGSLPLLAAGLGGLWYLRFRRLRARRVINEASGHPSSVGRAADS